ncbi:cysteine proteinase [Purpureocillium lilacinum]|uniref:Ubiquitin carboxyl-terminal hydrolase n=1 Tax=Purpureocillium lilacinum TaxID=33203 RepID=A0A179FJF1_PURLI|nr:cysteine proteinase [Purpureocillium lilacinum]OAQ65765.1 cysteine proteinase [Purpureocillium lilacinum]
MSDCYRKHFFPLESDPAIFTELSHLLGSPASLIFEDVLSLDEAERLPHPALALVLVLPTTAVYEKRKQHEDALSDVCPQADLEEDVVWFKQTINNACGLYALLHALANSEARCMIRPSSVMARVMNAPPGQRYLIVEGSEELERVYANVATKGQSISPASAEDELDLHYVCFVRSQKNEAIDFVQAALQ